MSFHQLKLQKDALRSLHQIPLSTNDVSQPLPTNINSTDAVVSFGKEVIGRNEDNVADLSELEYGEESWTTMSEIDSQYSRSSKSMSMSLTALELSRITDSDDSDNDDVDEGRPTNRASRIKKQRLLPPVGIISTQTGMMQHHNSLASGRIIGGTRLISPKQFEENSDALPSRPRSQSLGNGQERVEEAEAQVLHAREELARVTMSLEELQEQHELKVRDLQEELAAMKLKEQQQEVHRLTAAKVQFDDDGNKVSKEENIQLQQSFSKIDMDVPGVALIDSEYEDQLEIAQKEKQAAESKLADAIKKLRKLESEKRKMVEESRELQTKLESTLKKVHFAEEQNSVLEFRVDEYKTKWEDSIEQAQQMESKLVTTRCDLENAVRQAELTKESCNVAVANAANERSLREEHARKEHLTAQQLSAQCRENEQLKKEQIGLEKTVQSLQKERFGLREELEKTTSRRNDVEADLSRANDECQRLTTELENFRISMELLEADHDQKQKILQESLDAQLEELRASVALLAEKDELNEKKLSEYESEASKLKAEAEASQLKEQEQTQVEQRLLLDLKESREAALKQKEASDQKLEELRKSMDSLVVQNESNKKMLSERRAEMLKLKKDSEAAKVELQAKYEEEQQESKKVELELLSKLKVSSEKVKEQKELSDLKMEELRRSIDALVAKDELNQKTLLEYKAEMLNLKADSDAAKLEAQARYEQEQRKSTEMKERFMSELEETREIAQEQKESSDIEMDKFRKSIDDLIAKDELELEMLRKSIDALAFKDELNQKMLSEREEEELRLKASSKAAIMEAKAKYEEEQRKSAAVEKQLLADLKNSNAKARALQLEKDTLEENILTIKQEQCRLNEEITKVNDRWKTAEENAKRLDEEKRLLSADLSASRYSILRLEAEQSRTLAERDAMIESHRLEITEQKALVSSSEDMKLKLEKELNVFRKKQRDFEQDRAELEKQLHTSGQVHNKFVEEHEVSMKKFQSRIQELQAENKCLEKNSLDFESAKSGLELRLGNLLQEYKTLQQTQNETKLKLSLREKEQENFSKASSERYKLLETECSDLRIRVASLHIEELELEEKVQALADKLEVSRLKLEEKEKHQRKMDILLSEEKKIVSELEDQKEELMRKTTSMSVEHARSLVEFEKKTKAAEAKADKIEEECTNLKADIALTTAAKETLSWKQKAVKEELTQLQEAHRRSQERISELQSIQHESKISSEREIAKLMDMQERLEMEKGVSNQVRVELEETLNTITASWDDCKRALLEKESESQNLHSELAKTIALVQDLKEKQKLLLAEKEAAANEKSSMIALHSKTIGDYKVSAASLKEELVVVRTDMRIAKMEKENLLKKTEEFDSRESILKQECNAKTSLLKNTKHRLEIAEEQKSLLQSLVEDQSRFTDCLLLEKEKYKESLQVAETEKDELRSQFATAKSSIDGFEARFERLEKERKSLKDKIRDAGKREESLVSDLQLTKEDNAILKESKEALIVQHEHVVDHLETAKTKLEFENNGLIAELRSLEEQKVELMQQRDIADKKSLELNRELDDRDALNSKLIDERDDARFRIDQLETKQKQLKKDLADVELAKVDSESAAQSSISQLRRENAHLETEQELLRKQVGNLEAAKVEAENVSQSSISELRRENDRLGTENDLLSEQLAHLEAVKVEAESVSQLSISELRRENARLGTEKDLLREQLTHLESAKVESENVSQSSISELLNDKDRLITNLKEAKETISIMDTEADKIAKDNSCLLASLSEAREMIASLRREVDGLSSQNSSLIATAKEEQCFIANLAAEVAAVREDKFSLNTELHKATESVTNLETELAAEKKEKSSLNTDLQEANETIATLRTETDEILKENSSLNGILKEVKESVSNLEREVDEARKENSSLSTDLTEANESIATLRTEVAEAGKENCSLNMNLKEVKEAIAILHTDAAEAAKENSSLNANLKEAKETIATLHSVADEVAKENSVVLATLKGELTEANECIITLRTKAFEASKENASLNINLKEAQESIATLQTDATEAAKKNSDAITILNEELKEAKGTMESLQAKFDEASREKSCLTADLREAKRANLTLKTETDQAANENSCLIANLQDDLKAAKGTISTLETEADQAANENSCLIANLQDNLKDAEGTITALQTEADQAAKESTCLIANLQDDLKDAKGTISTLKTEADQAANENSCLIAKLEDNLKEAKGTISTLKTEADQAAKESTCLIANLQDDLKDAKGTISTLKTEADQAANENSCLIAKLEDNLKEAKGTISTLKTEADQAANENSCLIANLQDDLKDAKGTISTLQAEATDAAKENSCLIAKLEDNLKEAKRTIATLQTKFDGAHAQNSESVNIVKELRSEVAAMEKVMGEIEVERNRRRDEMEDAKEKLRKLTEESNNSILLQSVGEDTIRSLQNDLAKEKKKTESIMDEIKLVSRDKNELESRLSEVKDTLSKELEAKQTQDELFHREIELETKSLRQQLEEANSCSTHLTDVVASLEAEMKAERIRAANQEYLRSVDEAKIEQLKNKLGEQTKTSKKLAKLLKRTMTCVTRVSRMKMDVDLCYYDTTANEYRQMPGRAEYSGGVVSSKPHGAGVMKFEGGDVYLGTFDHGELSGDGSYIVAPQNKILSKGNGKLHFKGLYDYNEIMRQRIQH